MPRENNPNILLKARKLPAKTDEPLQFIHQALPLPLPLAKPLLTLSSPPQFHPETTVPEPGLRATAKAGEWTPADEVRLSELHNQLGNRWSHISRTFEGKSDNCVKNHFFSRLRMSLRHLNKQLPAQSRTKPVKMHVLYKIMSTCEERFNPDSEYTQSFISFSYELKNKLLDFLLEKGNPSIAEIETTIEDMHIFNKQFKMRADILKIPKTSRVAKPKKVREVETGMQDDQSLSQSNLTPNAEMREGENMASSSGENWNSLESILSESWRLSEVLQLKNERVEIKMIDTEYLFDDEEGPSGNWPHLDLVFRRPSWDHQLI